jgi:hypothetical protein
MTKFNLVVLASTSLLVVATACYKDRNETGSPATMTPATGPQSGLPNASQETAGVAPGSPIGQSPSSGTMSATGGTAGADGGAIPQGTGGASGHGGTGGTEGRR